MLEKCKLENLILDTLKTENLRLSCDVYIIESVHNMWYMCTIHDIICHVYYMYVMSMHYQYDAEHVCINKYCMCDVCASIHVS